MIVCVMLLTSLSSSTGHSYLLMASWTKPMGVKREPSGSEICYCVRFWQRCGARKKTKLTTAAK